MLRHIEPQAPLTVVVWVETIPLCQGHVFATRLQRPCSFPDTSGTRRQQPPTIVLMFWTNVPGKKKGPNFSLLRKLPFPCFVFPDSGKFSEQSFVSQRLIKTPIRRNTQKQHLQNSDQNLTKKRKNQVLKIPPDSCSKTRLLDETPCI